MRPPRWDVEFGQHRGDPAHPHPRIRGQHHPLRRPRSHQLLPGRSGFFSCSQKRKKTVGGGEGQGKRKIDGCVAMAMTAAGGPPRCTLLRHSETTQPLPTVRAWVWGLQAGAEAKPTLRAPRALPAAGLQVRSWAGVGPTWSPIRSQDLSGLGPPRVCPLGVPRPSIQDGRGAASEGQARAGGCAGVARQRHALSWSAEAGRGLGGSSTSILFSPQTPRHGHRKTSAATARRLRGSPHTAAPPATACPTGLTSSRLTACQSRLAPAWCDLPGDARVHRAESFGLCFPPKQTQVTKVTWERELRRGHRRPPTLIRTGQSKTRRAQTSPVVTPSPGLVPSKDAAVSPSWAPTKDPPSSVSDSGSPRSCLSRYLANCPGRYWLSGQLLLKH